MKHTFTVSSFVICCILLISVPELARSQWSSDPAANTVVNNLAADQTSPQMTSDQLGGAIITWQDTRSGNSHIYAQRVDASGRRLWPTGGNASAIANGIAICTASGSQLSPAIIGDGLGGAIIAWQDTRNGNSDIYAERIDGTGSRLWINDGYPICAASGEQGRPVIVGDGVNGAIIAWSDYRGTGLDADIYAQRISAGGIVKWLANGVAACTATGDQDSVRMIEDGIGGAILVWQDHRSGASCDLYAQRLDKSGVLLWSPAGDTISVNSGDQRNPSLTGDGSNGVVITWQDARGSDLDIYVQHVNQNGVPLMTPGGIDLSSTGGDQKSPSISSDGSGNFIIGWQDGRNGASDIYAQRITATGAATWAANGISVCLASGDQVLPAVTDDGLDGVIIAWQDYRNGSNIDLYAQRVAPDSTKLWPNNGLAISSASQNQVSHSILSSGSNGAIITWQDSRDSITKGRDVYIQNANSNGSLGLSSISGMIFSDLNENGIKDTLEPGLAGWKVNLTTGVTTTTATTNGSGVYVITGLTTGIYTVTEVDSNGTGWLETFPAGGFYSVVIDSTGQNFQSRDFGNFHIASIRGTVFQDRNHDGVRGGADPALANWVVTLSGDSAATQTTDVNGSYVFAGLRPGTYFLQEQVKPGWSQAAPADSYTVTVTNGQQVANKDFGNFADGGVSGKFFADVVEDSVTDGDGPLSGWTVRLYRNGILQSQTATTGAGAFSFGGLKFGVYTIEESLYTGWAQTVPQLGAPGQSLATFGLDAGPRSYTFSIDASAKSVTNRDFANFQLGIVSGRKYRDVTGDSSLAGETTLNGWVIKLYQRSQDTTLIAQTVTHDTGDFVFAGLDVGDYAVAESLTAGWFETFPRKATPGADTIKFGTGNGPRGYKFTVDSSGRSFGGMYFGNFRKAIISGLKFNDLNHNGLRDSLDPGLADWNISLAGPGGSRSAFTDSLGSYSFTGLDSGTYVVSEVQQPGWQRTFPVSADTYRVTVGKGQSVTGRNFGNFISTSISGTVYEDRNGNGKADVGEPIISDWVVRLIDPGSGQVLRSVSTNLSGRYTFSSLPLGPYQVSESLKTGWKQTLPLSPQNYAIIVTGAQQFVNKNFGLFRFGIARGSKFNDFNGDGVKDPSEPGLGNWLILLSRKGSSAVIDSTLTDTIGNYTFFNLDTGKYKIQERSQVGWLRTLPDSSYAIADSLSGQSFGGLDFGNFRWSTISGTVFVDLDGNGSKGIAEAALSNWRVLLSPGGGGSPIESTLTAANGVYDFTGLASGFYSISVRSQAPYVLTSPQPAGVYSITIDAVSGDFTGNDFGYFSGSIGGSVINDLNGNDTADAGEPALANWRIVLKSGTGIVLDSMLTSAGGSFSFPRLIPGLYTVTERVQGGWLATIPSAAASYDVAINGSHVNVTNLVFANFHLATISGKVYDDANRNGVLDGSESPLVNYPIYLKKESVQISRITSSFTGDYSFTNLVAGNYAVSESIRTAGYRLSFPPSPGVFTFTPLSGDNLTGNNFGNYVATANSITIRTFSDQDGSTATLGDAKPKSWNLKLYRDSVAVGSLVKDTTTSVLTLGSLAPGVYIINEADSAGWLHLGLIHDTSAIARNTGADTVALAPGQSHYIDFLKFNPGRLVVRKLSDADGLTSTATDRNMIPWNLSLYRGFVAPGNLFRSVASAESLFVDSLPKGTYVAVESDSAGWKHIGTVAGRSGAVVSESSSVSSKQFTLNAADAYRVDFINANAGSLAARVTRDTDGRFATGGDRQAIRWPLKLYRGTVSPANLISSVNAESLVASNIDPGVYVVVESDSSAWSHLGTNLDGSDSAGSHHSISINVVRNHKSILQFANYFTRNRKVWTASADCEWGNARNWNPQDVPQPPDTVVIPVTSRPCVPVVPPHTSVAAISIDQGAALRIPPNDTLFIAGDVNVDGTLLGNPLDSSVIVISGNWIVHGSFDAARSRLLFSSSLDQTMSGGSCFSLQIGRDSTTTGGTVSILNKTVVGGRLTLHKDLAIVQDTLFIENDSPGAEEGAGSVKSGTMQRVIRQNTAQPYPLESQNSPVAFHGGLNNPRKITVGIFSDRSPADFGSSWSPIGGVVDSASNTITLDSVRNFSRLTCWAFGINQSGIGLPIVRRVYKIDAHGDTGFFARLALHYRQSEVPVGVNETSLILLQQNFAVRESVAAGWNMVSIPVTPHVLLKSVIFPNAASPAFMYTSGSGYSVQDTLKPGIGYWLRFNSTQLVDVPGEMITQDTVDLSEGWNLVGTPSFVADVGQVSTSPETIVSSKFFGYGGGYYIATTFRPLKAYWVKTSLPGKLFVPAASSQYLGKNEAPNSDLSSRKDLNTLNFLDAAGHGQSLYFGSARDINSQIFDMPPQPPSESFDVRFSSNKMLEIYPADSKEIRELHILMQAPVYPLRISWQLANSPRERVTLTDDAGGKLIGKRILRREGTMVVENPSLHRLFLRIDEGGQIPLAFSLKQCYPNPFNPKTTIEFDLPNPARVSLKVYDLLGKEVAVLAENRDYEAGTYTLQFDASAYASGVYFYRLAASSRENTYQKVLKMILLR